MMMMISHYYESVTMICIRGVASAAESCLRAEDSTLRTDAGVGAVGGQVQQAFLFLLGQ